MGLRQQHGFLAVGARADALGDLRALSAELLGLAPAFGLHAAENRLAVGLGQISPLDADVDDQDAEAPGLLVHRIGDLLHQLFPLARQHGGEGHVSQDPAQARVQDRVEPGPRRPLIPDALKELQRIDDSEAQEGVDDEPLLVRGDDLLGRSVEGEDALVETFHFLNERDLHLESRLPHHPFGVAELQHQRLLGLMDGKQRAGGDYAEGGHGDRHDHQGSTVHRSPPPWRLLFSSSSGR